MDGGNSFYATETVFTSERSDGIYDFIFHSKFFFDSVLFSSFHSHLENSKHACNKYKMYKKKYAFLLESV